MEKWIRMPYAIPVPVAGAEHFKSSNSFDVDHVAVGVFSVATCFQLTSWIAMFICFRQYYRARLKFL